MYDSGDFGYHRLTKLDDTGDINMDGGGDDGVHLHEPEEDDTCKKELKEEAKFPAHLH